MPKNFFRFWVIFVPYFFILFLSLWLSVWLRYGQNFNSELFYIHTNAFFVLFIFWQLVFFIHGLFEIQTLRRYTGVIFNLISAMSVNVIISAIYFYFQSNLITPKKVLFILAAVSFILLLAWHLFVKLVVRSKLVEFIYLFSFNNELADLEKEIETHQFLGFKVLGHLNDSTIFTTELLKNSAIVLPDNLNSRPEIAQQFYNLTKSGISFKNFRFFYENLLRRVYLNEINELWFLENISYQEKRLYNLIKRLFDLIFGVIGFLCFMVSYPICALLIKLSDKHGPVLFTQERVGQKGRIFKVYKYRTMRSGTATNTWTSVNDPRILPIGKFLRKSRIDEWPQFVNLLIGNMSLVGPRPEQPQIVKDLSSQIPFYEERHLVKPGLTGWAQINNIYAGNTEETKLKLQYDLYYIKHRSFLFDLEIILKTIYYIFTWQGR